MTVSMPDAVKGWQQSANVRAPTCAGLPRPGSRTVTFFFFGVLGLPSDIWLDGDAEVGRLQQVLFGVRKAFLQA